MTTEEAKAILERVMPAETSQHDEEELETYLYGPDDPDEYFSKVEGEAELVADFKEFLAGYERG